MTDIFRDLIDACRDRVPTGPGSEENPLFDVDIEANCEVLGLSFQQFSDQLAYQIATSYIGGEISYEVGDNTINALLNYSMVGPPRQFLNGFAVLIYDAFDAGEFDHAGDAIGEDLGEKHTRPALERILAAHDGPNNLSKPMLLGGAT